tara:strand:+ start:316 stop:867 length:552 start_codon:yes stop_codon:yes gene_type:complete
MSAMSCRLFFALRPPVVIRESLLSLMEQVSGARWQDDDQLHLTLRYIGETDERTAEDIADAASHLAFAPFDISVDGCSYFARKGIPTQLYAVIKPDDRLAALHKKIDRICVQCGIEPERRKFLPHITLARLNRSTGPLSTFLAKHGAVMLGPWRVDDYILYESHLREQGSLYEPLCTYSARIK